MTDDIFILKELAASFNEMRDYIDRIGPDEDSASLLLDDVADAVDAITKAISKYITENTNA